MPFRGEYFELKTRNAPFVKPYLSVPDPKIPRFGCAFYADDRRRVTCGPNAVLAFVREGYNLTDFNSGDLAETLRYSGFRKLAAKHLAHGHG